MKSKAEAHIHAARAVLRDHCNALGFIHSLRLVLTPPNPDEGLDLGLLLNVVHDRTDAQAVQALAPGLRPAIGPLVHSNTDEGLCTLLLHHELTHHTMFISNIGATVEEVKAENALYRFLQRELDELIEGGEVDEGTSPEQLRQTLRSKVLTARETLPESALPPLTEMARRRRRGDLLRTFGNPLVAILYPDIFEAIRRLDSPARAWATIVFVIYLPLAAVLAFPAMIVLRLVELFERDVDTGPPSDQALDAIEDREDMIPKNAVTLLFPVKPSFIRRFIMHQVLGQAEKGCRHFWTHGRLVRIETIHYARLLMSPSRKTMVFLSDYDGALDRYLDDFLGVGSRAVVPISSSVYGCPPTRWLKPSDISVFRGRWRALIRRHQHLEAFWYTAYPELDTDQIRNHRVVRQELFAESMDDADAEAWLRRL